MHRPSYKVRAKMLENGRGQVEISFDRQLEVSEIVDLLRACEQKLFTSPRLFLSFEGDPKVELRDFEHCREVILKPPSPASCHEVSIGSSDDQDDLVSISLDRL